MCCLCTLFCCQCFDAIVSVTGRASGILMAVMLTFCCSGSTSRRIVWSIIVIVIVFICTVVLAIIDSSSCKSFVLFIDRICSDTHLRFLSRLMLCVPTYNLFSTAALFLIMQIISCNFYRYYPDWQHFR